MQVYSGSGSRRNVLYNSLHLIFVSAAYVVFIYPVLGSPSVFPVHDNMYYQMPTFLYISSSLLYGYVPLWDPSYGGIPMGVTPISLLPFVRIFGSLLYIVLPLDAITIYKITLVLWMLTIALGWWLFLYTLCSSRVGATFGTLMVLFGGIGITIFHQEQMLATLFWLPWILLTLFQIKKDIRFIMVLAVLAGFSMTVHYPQIQLITFLFISVVLLLTRNVEWAFLKGLLKKWRLAFLSLILFILAASPTIYLNTIKDDFSSLLRQSYSVDIDSYDDYIALNKAQVSSAPFKYVKNYISPESGVFYDQFVAYATYTGLFLAFLGVLFRPKKGIPILILLVLFGWASLGINAYLPQLLYVIRFPFIDIFRQWYHFMPLVNLCLSALGALGFSAIFSRGEGLVGGKKVVVATVLSVITIGSMYLEGSSYFKEYAEKKLPHMSHSVEKLGEDEFLFIIRNGHFGTIINMSKFRRQARPEPHLIYREWYELSQVCKEALETRPFFTGSIYNDVDLPITRQKALIKELCASRKLDKAVLASIPASANGSSNVRLPGIINLGDGATSLTSMPQSKGKYYFPDQYYQITPSGAGLRGAAPMNGLVVFPFCYKNGLKAFLNGREVETYPVNGGAFTGVAVPRGRFNISLEVPFSGYQASLLIQATLLLLVAVFSLVLYRRRGGKHYRGG